MKKNSQSKKSSKKKKHAIGVRSVKTKTAKKRSGFPSTNHLLIQKIRFVIIFQLLVVFLVVLHIPSKHEALEEQRKIVEKTKSSAPNKERIELKDEELKKQIEEIVSEVHGSNKEFFKGIDQIFVSKEDLDFNKKFPHCDTSGILGAYSGDKIIIKDSGYEVNKKTLFHEIGHNMWKEMGREKKNEWVYIFKKSKTFLNSYAASNPNENFAENFACFYTNFKNCTRKMEASKKRFIARNFGTK